MPDNEQRKTPKEGMGMMDLAMLGVLGMQAKDMVGGKAGTLLKKAAGKINLSGVGPERIVEDAFRLVKKYDIDYDSAIGKVLESKSVPAAAKAAYQNMTPAQQEKLQRQVQAVRPELMPDRKATTEADLPANKPKPVIEPVTKPVIEPVTKPVIEPVVKPKKETLIQKVGRTSRQKKAAGEVSKMMTTAKGKSKSIMKTVGKTSSKKAAAEAAEAAAKAQARAAKAAATRSASRAAKIAAAEMAAAEAAKAAGGKAVTGIGTMAAEEGLGALGVEGAAGKAFGAEATGLEAAGAAGAAGGAGGTTGGKAAAPGILKWMMKNPGVPALAYVLYKTWKDWDESKNQEKLVNAQANLPRSGLSAEDIVQTAMLQDLQAQRRNQLGQSGEDYDAAMGRQQMMQQRQLQMQLLQQKLTGSEMAIGAEEEEEMPAQYVGGGGGGMGRSLVL